MNTLIYFKLTGPTFSSNLTAVKSYTNDDVAAVELRPTASRVKVVSKLTGDEKISSLKIKIIFISRTFVSRLHSGVH
jgi:hypothetical protein